MKKLLTVLAAVCLAFLPAFAAAEGAALEENALELFGSSVRFPAVTGMADETAQAAVNARIREDLRVDAYLERMTALISDEARFITVDWSGRIAGDVFSGQLEAETTVRGLLSAHEWAWSSVDLRDGHEIAFGELFTDEVSAREGLETLLEDLLYDLSPHLQNSSLTPLPEGFRMERTGLTLLYGADQLSTLRDRAGAVKIGWNEIRDFVDWSAEGIPARIGAAEMVNWTDESADGLRTMAESGMLTDIPVKIGDSVKEWTDRMHPLYDPEEYALGRMFTLEGAAFRDVYLLSDAVDRGWENSRVQGIRMDRGCLWGLCVGETEASVWRQTLGEPEHMAVFDAEKAESYRTVSGQCDYYKFGDYTLGLQSDTDGILVSITLTQ